MNLKIRNATSMDKVSILKFCQNTFSWGDYIEYVWDSWLAEDHLFLAENSVCLPVGICHAFYSKDQIWIEGIRVDPNFRCQNIASKLVNHIECIGKQKNLPFSYMLIDTKNSVSLLMADSLKYDVFQTWNFYSLSPKTNSNYNITFEKSLDRNLYSYYVKSWRWLFIDDDTLQSFYEQNSIIKSCGFGNKDSIAILSDSEHFEKTLLVTLFSNSNESVIQILLFLQNFGIQKNYKRIQILTRQTLPNFDSLEHNLSFYLMKKSLI